MSTETMPRLTAGLLPGAVLLAMLPHQTIGDAIGGDTHHVVAPVLVTLWWALFCRQRQEQENL